MSALAREVFPCRTKGAMEAHSAAACLWRDDLLFFARALSAAQQPSMEPPTGRRAVGVGWAAVESAVVVSVLLATAVGVGSGVGS